MSKSTTAPGHQRLAWWMAFFVLLAMAASQARAGQTILTVTDTAGQRHEFDAARLESLGLVDVVTRTPWTDGQSTFKGPRLGDVLRAAGVASGTVHAVALNDYRHPIPVEDADRYGVILALYQDGKRLTVRTRGPVWVMYPYDERSELRAQEYYARAVWQLRELASVQ